MHHAYIYSYIYLTKIRACKKIVPILFLQFKDPGMLLTTYSDDANRGPIALFAENSPQETPRPLLPETDDRLLPRRILSRRA